MRNSDVTSPPQVPTLYIYIDIDYLRGVVKLYYYFFQITQFLIITLDLD